MLKSDLTITALFEATCQRKSDASALGVIHQGELRWLSWRALKERVEEESERLQKESLQGDTLLLSGPNSLEWIVRDLAAHRVGLVSALSSRYVGARKTGDLATIVPTSGTSGKPRGVMLSHANLAWTAQSVAETVSASVEGDTGNEIRLSILPFSHLFARVCDLYAWIVRGSRLVLGEGREHLVRDCQLARPTALNGVPYLFQKLLDRLHASRDAGQATTLRHLLGGEIKRCYCGGAALAPQVQQAFSEDGLPLMNGYGLSEASPVVSLSTIKENRPGAVGKPLPGVEIQFADDGEVLVKGPNVMLGYWQDGSATAEVLREGWLRTGDLGAWDEAGHLTLRGRKKEILILATGKNVAPAPLEALLCASPWIEQACIVGENHNYLGALLVPNRERVRAEVRRRRLWVWSKRQALRHRAIRKIFAKEISRLLAGRPRHEQVRAFVAIPRGFSLEQGEMTPKLSLRRDVIERTLSREILAMFRLGEQRRQEALFEEARRGTLPL